MSKSVIFTKAKDSNSVFTIEFEPIDPGHAQYVIMGIHDYNALLNELEMLRPVYGNAFEMMDKAMCKCDALIKIVRNLERKIAEIQYEQKQTLEKLGD